MIIMHSAYDLFSVAFRMGFDCLIHILSRLFESQMNHLYRTFLTVFWGFVRLVGYKITHFNVNEISRDSYRTSLVAHHKVHKSGITLKSGNQNQI